MRSIFHTKAATPEELRSELIADLENRIAAERVSAEHRRSTIVGRAILDARLNLLYELARFWSDIIIDKSTPEEFLP